MLLIVTLCVVIRREQPVIETETDDRDLDTGAADNILLQVKAQELKKENELLKQKLAQVMNRKIMKLLLALIV